MANYSFPFGSINGDRKYGVSIFTKYWSTLVGNGVFGVSTSNRLQVLAENDNMSITLKAGESWFGGRLQWLDTDMVIDIDPADGALNRWDAIAIRFDYGLRDALPYYKKGTPASNPSKPVVERSSAANELILGYIYVGKGVVKITQDVVEDARGYTDVCGFVHGLVDQADVTTIWNQYFVWFEMVKKLWADWWYGQEHPDGYLTRDNPEPLLGGQTVIDAINGKENPLDYEAKVLYVSPNGNDDSADGSVVNPFKTLQAAFDYIPTNWQGEVTLNLMDGNYYPADSTDANILNVTSYKGLDSLVISGKNTEASGNETVLYGAINLSTSKVKLALSNFKMYPNDAGNINYPLIYMDDYGTLSINRVGVFGSQVYPQLSTTAAIRVSYGKMYIRGNSIVDRAAIGILADRSGTAFVSVVVGSRVATAFRAATVGMIIADSTSNGLAITRATGGMVSFGGYWITD